MALTIKTINGLAAPAGGTPVSFSDDFLRGSYPENPLSKSSAWSKIGGSTSAFAVASAYTCEAQGNNAVAQVVSETFANDQFASIKIGGTETGIYLRKSRSNGTGYLLYQTGSVVGFYEVTDNGSLGFNQIGGNETLALTTDDWLTFSAVGTTLSCYKNDRTRSGSPAFTRTGQTAFTSGDPGIFASWATKVIYGFEASDS